MVLWRSAFAVIAVISLASPTACVPSESSDEDEAWAEFRGYLESRQRCTVNEDCVVVEVRCPLGCSYGVNESHAADVRRKAAELIEDYEDDHGSCASCTQIDAAGCTLTCREGRCLSPYDSRCGREPLPDAGP